MLVDCVSDLHGYMPRLPGGDVLIIGGDCTARDLPEQWRVFGKWIGGLDYEYVLLIWGNHDFAAQSDKKYVMDMMPSNVTCLEDSGCEIEGVTFWGSPFTPQFFNWAFMLPRNGSELRRKWEAIPAKLDVLITHGPPYNILDESIRKDKCGCEILREEVLKKDVKNHVFGHIHEGGGLAHLESGTNFYNISYLNARYEPREENWCRRLEI